MVRTNTKTFTFTCAFLAVWLGAVQTAAAAGRPVAALWLGAVPAAPTSGVAVVLTKSASPATGATAAALGPAQKARLTAEIERRAARIKTRLRELQTQRGSKGTQGEPGIPGETGPHGIPGRDGQVAAITAVLAQLDTLANDYAQLRNAIDVVDYRNRITALRTRYTTLLRRISDVNRNPSIMRGGGELPAETVPEKPRLPVLDWPRASGVDVAAVRFWRPFTDPGNPTITAAYDRFVKASGGGAHWDAVQSYTNGTVVLDTLPSTGRTMATLTIELNLTTTYSMRNPAFCGSGLPPVPFSSISALPPGELQGLIGGDGGTDDYAELKGYRITRADVFERVAVSVILDYVNGNQAQLAQLYDDLAASNPAAAAQYAAAKTRINEWAGPRDDCKIESLLAYVNDDDTGRYLFASVAAYLYYQYKENAVKATADAVTSGFMTSGEAPAFAAGVAKVERRMESIFQLSRLGVRNYAQMMNAYWSGDLDGVDVRDPDVVAAMKPPSRYMLVNPYALRTTPDFIDLASHEVEHRLVEAQPAEIDQTGEILIGAGGVIAGTLFVVGLAGSAAVGLSAAGVISSSVAAAVLPHAIWVVGGSAASIGTAVGLTVGIVLAIVVAIVILVAAIIIAVEQAERDDKYNSYMAQDFNAPIDLGDYELDILQKAALRSYLFR